MVLRMQPFVPMLPGESFVSWFSRFARVQCDMTSKDFASFLRLPLESVEKTQLTAVTRMHELSGIPAEQLELGGYKQLRYRVYQHRGETFHSEFVSPSQYSICPCCLVNDIVNTNASFGLPVGQINWAFVPIRTCPIHSVPLVRCKRLTGGMPFQDVAANAPEMERLLQFASSAQKRELSGLQCYVAARLEGKSGSKWLDNQMIDLASRATEMLGACIEFGPFVNLPSLTQSQWDLAGQIGFSYTSRGDIGVREGLEVIQKNVTCSRTHVGPQGVFGVLYQWIQFKQNSKPVGPFREVFREHILDTIPISVGTDLFGETVERRRRHSVASLSQEFDVHPNTVQNALIRSGMLPRDYDPARHLGAVSVLKSERLMKKMLRSVPVSRIPDYLGCKRPQVANLIKEKILVPIEGERDGRRSISQGVVADDLDAFLRQLRERGKEVCSASDGMQCIVEMAETLKVPSIDIVKLLLRRGLNRVELLSEKLRFASVLVDEAEVAMKLGVRNGCRGVTITETARSLGLSMRSVEQLLNADTSSETPALRACGQVRHMGRMRNLVDPESIAIFRSTFQRVSDVAADLGKSVQEARTHLEGKGVFPVWDTEKIGAEIYRVADI